MEKPSTSAPDPNDERVAHLESALAEATRELSARRDEVTLLSQKVARVEGSVTWKLFERVRGRLYAAIGGRDGVVGRTLQRTLRGAARIAGGGRRPGASAPEGAPDPGQPVPDATPATPVVPPPLGFRSLDLPRFAEPVVSIVVPVHRDPQLSFTCLETIAQNTGGVAYEVIVVDDSGDDENGFLWDLVSGVRVVRNEENAGYLRSVNRGAAEASGRFLVLLDNDTEVEPGWLEALLRRADSAPDVGAVAPALLYRDRSLQEAGSIVFRDGTRHRYGRGQDPDAPAFSFAREVDAASAACLLVRRDVFDDLGGLDERFDPMDGADLDLCFGVRAAGRRVMFEPRARVVHHEAASTATVDPEVRDRARESGRAALAEKWRDALERQDEPDESRVRHASSRATGPHVLVVDHRVPTPDVDSGSLRMWRIVEGLLGLGCRVSFLPDDGLAPQPQTAGLQSLGVEVLHGPVNLAAELESAPGALALAILSRPAVAARHLDVILRHAPQARIAFDTVDLHFVREQRHADLGDRGAQRVAATMKELELGLVRGTDVTLVVSDTERDTLLAEVPGADVRVVPNVHDVEADVAPCTGREGILFLGGFQHAPNADAVEHLVRDVMPAVWEQRPDLRVTVVGRDAPDAIEALASDRVTIAGWVPDLEPLLSGSRMMVAPLRFGAGMKGKVTQSLAHGLPVVTTSIGAEGLGLVDGADALLGDDPGGLAERIVRLAGDDELWRTLSAGGQAVVERRCSRRVVEAELERLLADAGRSQPSPQPRGGIGSAPAARSVPGRARKLGVVLTYDDVDIVADTIGHLLEHDHDVVVWDNGSTDGTFERVQEMRPDLLELRRVPKEELGLYEIYGAMSHHLIDDLASRYDWVSWPDSDEILLGEHSDEPYGEYVDRLVRSPYDWCEFRNWNFWWTEEDDPRVESPVARIRHYALFDNCAPRVRAWRAKVTNVREFNHNPLPGTRAPELANLCHYPFRSEAQARERLRTRADIQRGEQNWHYNRIQREPDVVRIDPTSLQRADRDPREGGLVLVPGEFDWFSVYGR